MANASSLGSAKQLRDPDYTPPLAQAIPLSIQHILAMFISNVTPAIIVAGAAGFGFGSNSPDFPQMLYMIQMSMLFAGIATLLQTVGFGPVGARLPVVQGTSFAFIPIMIPLVAGKGVDAIAILMGGVLIGGLFHACLGLFIGRIAAGGVPAMGTPEFGSLKNWFLACIVIVVTLGLKFFTRGMLSVSAVLLGIIAGYIVAFFMGEVNFGNVGKAAFIALPDPTRFGIEFTAAAIIGFCAMSFISAVETVGDVSAIAQGGAGREATEQEITGATYADGLGSAIAGIFGGLPNTSFSQNVDYRGNYFNCCGFASTGWCDHLNNPN